MLNEKTMREVLTKWKDHREVGGFASALLDVFEPAKPVPDRAGQWFADASHCNFWYGPILHTQGDEHYGHDCYYGSPWQLAESWITNGKYLRIPPRPDVPDGEELSGEVRAWRASERFINKYGKVGVVFHAASIDPTGPYGGRRWILKPKLAESSLHHTINDMCGVDEVKVAAVRWEHDGGAHYDLYAGETEMHVFAREDSTPADREAVRRAFDSEYVTAPRKLVEAYERLAKAIAGSGHWTCVIGEALAALDAAGKDGVK